MQLLIREGHLERGHAIWLMRHEEQSEEIARLPPTLRRWVQALDPQDPWVRSIRQYNTWDEVQEHQTSQLAGEGSRSVNYVALAVVYFSMYAKALGWQTPAT
eukprot:4469095-Amphidinium_carterae.1